MSTTVAVTEIQPEKMDSRVLIAGIDTLEVGFSISKYKLTHMDWDMLMGLKEQAQRGSFNAQGVPVVFQGYDFILHRAGRRGYEYVLTNDDISVSIAPRSEGGISYPEVHVTWRSQYLWRHGWRAAYRRIAEWVSRWAVVASEKVSRADFCQDISMELPDIKIREHEVVSRARHMTEYIQHHFDGWIDTGYTFGKGDVKCDIYDKRQEIKGSHKEWFEDMWLENDWDGVSDVTRVEFQCRRQFLRSMQVETVADLEAQMADIMKYLMTWISLRDKNPGDSNRSRWPVKPFWQVVEQSVHRFGVVAGVMRITQRRPRLVHLNALARGVLVSMAAMSKTTYPHASSGSHIAGVMASMRSWIESDDFMTDFNVRAHKLALIPD